MSTSLTRRLPNTRWIFWTVVALAVTTMPRLLTADVSEIAVQAPNADAAAIEKFRRGAVPLGAGTTAPVPIASPRPAYTSQAMKAEITGVVTVEAVVLEDGTVGRARLLKGIDAHYGLDAQAIVAALNWRFTPATQNGQPVAVFVTIDLSFRLR